MASLQKTLSAIWLGLSSAVEGKNSLGFSSCRLLLSLVLTRSFLSTRKPRRRTTHTASFYDFFGVFFLFFLLFYIFSYFFFSCSLPLYSSILRFFFFKKQTYFVSRDISRYLRFFDFFWILMVFTYFC